MREVYATASSILIALPRAQAAAEHFFVKRIADRGDAPLAPGALARRQRDAETFSNAFYCTEQLRRHFGLCGRCKI